MNCKDVEELLSLYVGRDLEERRARLVTAHVQACRQCARSAQEYGEANQLLQLFEPPQFSEATYAAVRSGVLREIERESSAPQSMFALEFLRRFFQPRIMLAVSTVVLLAVCLFAYYFSANRTGGEQGEQQRAEYGGAGEQNTPEEQANAGSDHVGLKAAPSPANEDIKPDVTGTAGVPPAAATPPQKLRLHQAAWHSRRSGETPAVPVRTAQNSPQPKVTAPNTSPAADKTLRLEIQTSDRNIRIIWFSHPSTKEGSPSESSKGI